MGVSSVCQAFHAGLLLRSLQQGEQDPEGHIHRHTQTTGRQGRRMANQHLRVVLRRSSINRNRGIRHIDHRSGRGEIGERETNFGKPSGVRRLRHLVSHSSLLLCDSGGNVLVDIDV